MPAPPIHIVWFKRDLRTVDHRPLVAALATDPPVLPLYVAEPDWWAGPDMSARQWGFVADCLSELRADLTALGQPLIIRMGTVIDTLGDIAQQFSVKGLWSHEETGNAWSYARDKQVDRWCRTHGVPWTEIPQAGVIRPLKTRNGWAKKWDKQMGEPLTPVPVALLPIPGLDPGPIPTAPDLRLSDDFCPERQSGGRVAAISMLDSFFSTRGETYRKGMSSPLTGFDVCSRLSPHLAWGTISMRETAQATWTRQRHLKDSPQTAEVIRWRGALSSFTGRLHWRDHFTQKLEDAPRIEEENFHRGYDGVRPKEPDARRLAAWTAGETGWPFVDACLRALNATGYLNFRMRAMVMAVASYHLWLDWRAPGLHLARQFTDYEPGIHWPQVQMQSGTTGINTVRVYNPIKQGLDHDPDGLFVKRWVPELEQIPAQFVHTPWEWMGGAGVLGKTYPFPIVDHLSAAKEARQRIYAVRKTPAFRSEAKAIQHAHGSRRSGIPMRGARSNGGRRRPQAER